MAEYSLNIIKTLEGTKVSIIGFEDLIRNKNVISYQVLRYSSKHKSNLIILNLIDDESILIYS